MNGLRTVAIAVVGFLSLTVLYVHIPWLATTYDLTSEQKTVESSELITSHTPAASAADTRASVTHVPLPESVRAVYMTACVVGTPARRDALLRLIEDTELNAVMIDIKDYSGGISFPPRHPDWQAAWDFSACGAPDMQAFIATLHERGIYVIGRITVFQDPFWAHTMPHLAVQRTDRTTVWHDHKGLAFIDVAARDYWDHIINVAVDAYAIGFDELNFDYVRYPSDGDMADTVFPHTERSAWPGDRAANLEAFFAYLATALREPERFNDTIHINTGRATATPWLSVDIFGMTTTNTDDLSIGQVLERAVPYFDFVAPMVYPSHYPDNYLGLGDPNDHPYEIVAHAMQAAVARLRATSTVVAGFTHTLVPNAEPLRYAKAAYEPARLRTWIQDFDYGGEYDAADVRAQIQASYDAGVLSWMVWSPSNHYTRAAFMAPE
jgi:hypothetical protein